MRSRFALPGTFTFFVLILTSQARAVLIRPFFNWDDFPNGGGDVIVEAVQEWNTLLPCNDGFRLDIFLTCDITLNTPREEDPPYVPALGKTRNWIYDDRGRPYRADIVIDNDDHSWTLEHPVGDKADAGQTLKHEIAHALGFTVNSPAFSSKVWPRPPATAAPWPDRFYDYNGDHLRNGNDFDLIDDPGAGTHAVDGSGDLMESSWAPSTIRRLPSSADVAVLVDAFGYCPEPAGLLLLSLATLALRRNHRA